MGTTTKRQTWQELAQRGGPYTPEEMRVLYDRPGMTSVGGDAWRCDTCGGMRGHYTSSGLAAAGYPNKPVTSALRPRTPEEEAEEREAVEAVLHFDGILRDIAEERGRLGRERLEHTRYIEAIPARAAQGIHVDPIERTRREFSIQQLDARLGRLAVAEAEAKEMRAEPTARLDEVLHRVAAQRTADSRAAVEADRQEDRKPNALERFLSGKL